MKTVGIGLVGSGFVAELHMHAYHRVYGIGAKVRTVCSCGDGVTGFAGRFAIPGTAASCADGYALARRGEAGRAIGIAASGAFTSTLFGVLCLAAFTPLLARVALSFGSYEFFWLALFGVTVSGSIVGNDPVKGWLMGLLGLFVAQMGQEHSDCAK